MKKVLLTLSLVAVSAVAFGQGRVSANNNGHLITMGPVGQILAADNSFAGAATPVPADSGVLLPSAKILVAGIYAGTASGNETLQTTLKISQGTGALDGLFGATTLVLTGVPGLSPAFFRIDVWDAAFASAAAAQTGGSYHGTSGEWTLTPAGPAPATPASFTGAGSTWASAQPGPIVVTAAIPEPATFALAGLGAAAMLIFRRRK